MLRRPFAVLPSLLLLRSLFAQDCITDSPVDKTPNALIRKVVFQNAPLLSSQDQKQITSVVRDIEATGRVSAENIADEAAEQVRRAYLDNRYFKWEAQGKAAQLPDDAVAGINIVVRVLNEGKQYRLRDLTILNAIAFPEAQ